MSCCRTTCPCCCSIRTGPATTIYSSDKSCRCGACLPSICPHAISLLQPTSCDSSPVPSCKPDTYVATSWLLKSSYPTPGLYGINMTIQTQPGCQAPSAPRRRC